MTPVEIIAGIFLVLGAIKLVVLLVNKRSLEGTAKAIYSNPGVTKPILAILAIVVFYYLLAELSIVQIFAVMAFTSLLFALEFLEYKKDLLTLLDHVMKKKFSTFQSVYILVWVVLIGWGLKELFF